MTAGDFNARQKFDDRGLLWQIMELTKGGYAVIRFDRADPDHAIVASAEVSSVAEATELAEKLRKAALI